MNHLLQQLKPQAVFTHFEALCQIPHGSGNEKQIADHCEAFAKNCGLNCIRDAQNNLIITIPASAGYEDAKPVILQGHLDMVNVKTANSTHDFDKDPLDLRVDGDHIFAADTSLGGDDGIAIAMMLALMEDDGLPHPKLYCVMTTEEETCMGGVKNFNADPINDAAYLINIDSEKEGELCFGCAGGIEALAQYPLLRMKAKGLYTTITLSGLEGGHSGIMIDRFGANASILLADFLTELKAAVPFRIISINGGEKSNVIPDSAAAEILIGSESREALEEQLAVLIENYRKTTGMVDAACQLEAAFGEVEEQLVWDGPTEKRLLFALSNSPHGVKSMHRCAEGMVDGSLNLAIVNTHDDQITFEYFIRGNKDAIAERIYRAVENYTVFLNGTIERLGDAPAWEPQADSRLKTVFVDAFKDQYGRSPECVTVHAGVECGILSQKLPHAEMISIGPDITDIHTTEERLSIASTQRTWELLCNVLGKLTS